MGQGTSVMGKTDTLANRKKLMATLFRAISPQLVAATLAADLAGIAEQGGLLTELFIQVEAVAAAGESMQFDVLQNGVSILTGPFTYDAADLPDVQLDVMPLLAAPVTIAIGDVLTVARTYAAGGGPTRSARNHVVAKWEPTS
jgi:hypothetical protein